jgi:hypothetical protein
LPLQWRFAAAIPAVLPRLPLPGVVLEIVIGAIIDPPVLGLVRPGAALNFPADFGFGMLFPGSAARPLRSSEQAQSVLPSDLASSLHQGFQGVSKGFGPGLACWRSSSRRRTHLRRRRTQRRGNWIRIIL